MMLRHRGKTLYWIYLIGGLALVGAGLAPHGKLSSWALLLPGGLLLAAAVTKVWTSYRSAVERNRISNFVSGVILAAVAVVAIGAPLFFIAIGQYSNALITFATPVIGLYIGFIAYILIWDAAFDSQPPYAKQIGGWIARSVQKRHRTG